MAKVNKDFESKLLESLSKKNLSTSQLKKLTAQIAKFKKEGLNIHNVLVYGQPLPDKINIRGIIDPEFTLKFKNYKVDFNRFNTSIKGFPSTDTLSFVAELNTLKNIK